MKKVLIFILLFCTSLVLFSQSPKVDWLQQFGTGSDEGSNQIVVDYQGNYFTATLFKGSTTISGQSFTSIGSSNFEFIISKFDANQNLVWNKHMYVTNGPVGTGGMDFPTLKIDGGGNLYVCVRYDGDLHFDNLLLSSGGTNTNQMYAFAFIKVPISNTGTIISNLIQGNAYKLGGNDFFDITNSGEAILHVWAYNYTLQPFVIINGTNVSSLLSPDFGNMIFLRFNSSGSYLYHTIMPVANWNSGVSLNNSGSDIYFFGTNASAIILNSGTNLQLPSTSGSGLFIGKSQATSFAYVNWAKRILEASAGTASIVKIICDINDNMLILGQSGASLNFGNGVILTEPGKYLFIAKYSPTGEILHASKIGSGNVVIRGLSKDATGNLYICGHFSGNAEIGSFTLQTTVSSDAFVAKLNSNGICQWAFKGNSSLNASTSSVFATINENEIYTSGTFGGSINIQGESVISVGSTDPFNAKFSGCNIPNVIISPSGSVSICNWQSVTLSTPAQIGATYAWIKNNAILIGQANNSLVVSEPGNYSVIVSLGGACVDTSDVINVQQSSTVFTISTIPANTVGICPGNQLTLTTSIPFASYSWSNGNQSNLNSISQAGNYQVTVTDFSSCTGTAGIIISSFTSPPVPDIQANSGTDCILVCISTIQPTKYKWRKNGNIVGNNSQFLDITILGNGFYSVEITDANGCTSITSPCSITNCMDCIVGTHEQEKEKRIIRLYPNPSSGQLVCEVLEKGYYQLKVFNAIGGMEYSIEKVSEISEHNFSFLANGIYILQLETEVGNKIIEKLIIQN